MSLGLSNALQIAKTGLYVNEYLINVHGQNITNANTPGYSRKEVSLEPTTPITNVSPGNVGTGVKVTEIKRVVDQFLNIQLVKNNSQVNNWEAADKYLQQIERIFNNTAEGSLNSSLDDFWNAWLDLSNDPSNSAAREALLNKSKTLEDFFQTTKSQLDYINGSIEEEIKDKVDNINDIVSQIADLNDKIFNSEVHENNNANDLRDQRDKLLNKLSSLIDISYVEENHQFNVFLNNGTSLVTGVFTNTLTAEGDSDNRNLTSIYFNGTNDNSKINITHTIKDGALKGLIYARDLTQKYEDRLNTIANAIMKEVNNVHSQGIGTEALTDVTGSVKLDYKDAPFNYSGVQQAVNSGSFKLIVYDSNGNATSNTINIGDPDNQVTGEINSMQELVDYINTNVANVTASSSNNQLKITAASGYSFGFADDTSGVLSALGVNTYFKGDRYSLTKTINIVANNDPANAAGDAITFTEFSKKSLLTGHEYNIEFDASGNINITDINTGDKVSSIKTSISDGKYTLEFDGIKMQFGATKPANGSKYYIRNIDATSVIDDDNFSNHIFRLDFRNGTDNLSVFDVTDNLTLSSGDFTTTDLDIDGDGTADHVAVNIKKFGITATIKKDSFGVAQITPDKVGAQFIDNNISDGKNIAAAKIQTDNGNTFSIGDNRNALEIADLRDKKALNNGSSTINDYLSSFLAEIGFDRGDIKNKVDASKVTQESLQKQRDNVSGVSLDEEMTKLIQIQHAYSATAKLLNVVDSLMATLIETVS